MNAIQPRIDVDNAVLDARFGIRSSILPGRPPLTSRIPRVS
ncbi:hypothetical protein [Kribbella flavida]|nr:hypothetical protein [Kribbella flavida]